MKTFIAIFKCAESSVAHHAWMKLTEEKKKDRMKKGMHALELWFSKNKSHIVFDGGTLGNETKYVDNQGIQNIPSQVGHFFIIQANSHEEAAKIFVDHPHFAIFPGDGIEILECQEHPSGQFARNSEI